MDYIVWHINESEEELRAQLQHPEYFAQKLQNLKSGSRRLLEVLATRVALKELFYGQEQQVVYDADGRPSLVGERAHISISHTTDYAVVIASNIPVGVDIERRGQRVARVANRFLKPEELSRLLLLSHDDDELLNLMLHLAWSAKEAAFKVLGRAYYDLQRLTTITQLAMSEQQITLAIEGRNKPMTLHFYYNEDYVLVWVEDGKLMAKC